MKQRQILTSFKCLMEDTLYGLWMGGCYACDEAAKNKIRSNGTQTQSSHRGAGGLWGLFSANTFVSDSDVIIHQRETKLHDFGFGATFDRAWTSSRYIGVCIMK